jgi:hypothetical protein
VGVGRGSVTVPSRSFTERVRLPQWSLNPWILLLFRCSGVLLGGHVEQCFLVRGACFLGTDGYMRRNDDCGERIDKRKKAKTGQLEPTYQFFIGSLIHFISSFKHQHPKHQAYQLRSIPCPQVFPEGQVRAPVRETSSDYPITCPNYPIDTR